MILITSMCRNLTRLKLWHCRELTDSGMAVFTQNCKNLKEFSCFHCSFSDLGMFALLDNCTQLEVLSVKMSFNPPCDGVRPPTPEFRAVNNTLKVIKLRNVFNHRLFTPLISSSKNLKSLKMVSCGGKMGGALEMIGDDNCLVEVHLDHVSLSDVGVSSLAKCRDLIALYINNARCKEVGLISIAENCKGLKKLFVGHYLYRNEIGHEIGDEGLIAVGKHCVNLEELVLIGVKATYVSLQVVATNCQNLVRLELCHSDTITDVEMMCIVEKCVALKILRIDGCGVSNNGIEALGLGCPNLVNLMVIMCRKVTREVGDLLREKRGSLVVYVDEIKIMLWSFLEDNMFISSYDVRFYRVYSDSCNKHTSFYQYSCFTSIHRAGSCELKRVMGSGLVGFSETSKLVLLLIYTIEDFYVVIECSWQLTMEWVTRICHDLPRCIFTFSSPALKHLTLTGSFKTSCIPNSVWNFPALETLSLTKIRFGNGLDLSLDLFNQCVNLKDFILHDCSMYGVDTFSICAPHLVNLTVTKTAVFPEVFKVVAPQLETLTADGFSSDFQF
ncbi:F-box family protein [Artemisia annua]|uniref:F-box family protein n=1 Tax=Artemisia annua TaxID=35608 RepID=A0A2U1NL15_ARTAN|nr:F-box family protein [Artemisia annua]